MCLVFDCSTISKPFPLFYFAMIILLFLLSLNVNKEELLCNNNLNLNATLFLKALQNLCEWNKDMIMWNIDRLKYQITAKFVTRVNNMIHYVCMSNWVQRVRRGESVRVMRVCFVCSRHADKPSHVSQTLPTLHQLISISTFVSFVKYDIWILLFIHIKILQIINRFCWKTLVQLTNTFCYFVSILISCSVSLYSYFSFMFTFL